MNAFDHNAAPQKSLSDSIKKAEQTVRNEEELNGSEVFEACAAYGTLGDEVSARAYRLAEIGKDAFANIHLALCEANQPERQGPYPPYTLAMREIANAYEVKEVEGQTVEFRDAYFDLKGDNVAFDCGVGISTALDEIEDAFQKEIADYEANYEAGISETGPEDYKELKERLAQLKVWRESQDGQDFENELDEFAKLCNLKVALGQRLRGSGHATVEYADCDLRLSGS